MESCLSNPVWWVALLVKVLGGFISFNFKLEVLSSFLLAVFHQLGREANYAMDLFAKQVWMGRAYSFGVVIFSEFFLVLCLGLWYCALIALVFCMFCFLAVILIPLTQKQKKNKIPDQADNGEVAWGSKVRVACAEINLGRLEQSYSSKQNLGVTSQNRDKRRFSFFFISS